MEEKQKRKATNPAGGGGMKSRSAAKIGFEEKVQIFKQYYMDDIPTEKIAENFGIARSYVYRILSDKQLRQVIEAQRQATIDSMADAMGKNVPKIETILSKYLDLALDDSRIAETALPGLFTVYGIVIDKQMKLEENALKREELEVRRLEAQKAATANTGLLGDFMQIIQDSSSLPPRNEDAKDKKEN